MGTRESPEVCPRAIKSLRSLQFLGSAVNALSMRSFSLLLGNVMTLEDAELIELLEKLPQAAGVLCLFFAWAVRHGLWESSMFLVGFPQKGGDSPCFCWFPFTKGGKIDVSWSQRITERAALLRPQLKPLYI